MPPRPKWTHTAISHAKSALTGRLLSLVLMTIYDLQCEYARYYKTTAPSDRSTLLRYLVIEALDRALPDSGPPITPPPKEHRDAPITPT